MGPSEGADIQNAIDVIQAAAANEGLILACDDYIDRMRNDNNPDSQTNGEFAFLTTIAPFCRTVFDVGACVGDWTQRFLEIKPDAQAHCFEPLGVNQPALLQKLGGRAVLNGVALGAATGRQTLTVVGRGDMDEQWELSSLYKRQDKSIAATMEIMIDVMTLSDYCATNKIEHIDFLKIDTEGAEMDVLTGGRDLFAQGRIMAAQIEYGGTWLAARRQLKDVFDLMEDLPYVLAKVMPDRYMVVRDYWTGLDSYQYSNWLILHDDIVESL